MIAAGLEGRLRPVGGGGRGHTQLTGLGGDGPMLLGGRVVAGCGQVGGLRGRVIGGKSDWRRGRCGA